MDTRRRTNPQDFKGDSSQRRTLFLDDGGVLNDNGLRAREWPRLIGEFIPARLGGTAEAWAAANRVGFPEVWADLVRRMPDFASHREFQYAYATGWTHEMCKRIGITPPSDDDALTLYRELSIFVAEHAESAIAGAAEAVRALRAAGYTLYAASGTASWELRGIFGRMGILEAFSGLYGPDLVDHVKYGPAFYAKVLAHAGVSPEGALIVDSDEECCCWARQAGASAQWVDAARGDVRTLQALAETLL